MWLASEAAQCHQGYAFIFPISLCCFHMWKWQFYPNAGSSRPQDCCRQQPWLHTLLFRPQEKGGMYVLEKAVRHSFIGQVYRPCAYPKPIRWPWFRPVNKPIALVRNEVTQTKHMASYGGMGGFAKDSCASLHRRNEDICRTAKHYFLHFNTSLFGRFLCDSKVLNWSLILIMLLCEKYPIYL